MDDNPSEPITRAVSQALRNTRDPRVRSDFLFLESWEMHRTPNVGEMLRAQQIRRANPGLAEAINRELKAANAMSVAR